MAVPWSVWECSLSSPRAAAASVMMPTSFLDELLLSDNVVQFLATMTI